jgi:hypothetical protein
MSEFIQIDDKILNKSHIVQISKTTLASGKTAIDIWMTINEGEVSTSHSWYGKEAEKIWSALQDILAPKAIL